MVNLERLAFFDFTPVTHNKFLQPSLFITNKFFPLMFLANKFVFYCAQKVKNVKLQEKQLTEICDLSQDFTHRTRIVYK